MARPWESDPIIDTPWARDPLVRDPRAAEKLLAIRAERKRQGQSLIGSGLNGVRAVTGGEPEQPSDPFTRAFGMGGQALGIDEKPDRKPISAVQAVNQGLDATNDATRAPLPKPVQLAVETIKPDNVAERSWEHFSRGFQRLGGKVNDTLAILMDEMGATESADYQRSLARVRRAAGNRAIEGETTGDDVLGNLTLGNVTKFIAEQGIESTPDMVMAVGLLPAYAVALAGGIAQDRAENDRREEADLRDLLIALPPATVSAALERLPIFKIVEGKLGATVAGRLIGGGAIEAGTEAIQSPLEYAAGSVGTERGFDPEEAFKQAILGAIAGAGMGAGLAGATEVGRAGMDQQRASRAARIEQSAVVDASAIQALDPNGYNPGDMLRIRQSPLPVRPKPAGIIERASPAPVTPEDEASPLPTDLIAQGNKAFAEAQGRMQADDLLRANAAPSIGTRISFDGRLAVISDAFTDEDGEVGVTVRFDSGREQKHYFSELRDAEITLEPLPAPQAEIVPEPIASPAAMPQTLENQPSGGAQLKAAIRQVESSRNDNARNPKSSAAGRYQFTDGTFLQYYRREIGGNETKAQILSKKLDPQIQERLMDALVRDNEQALEKAGFEPTAGNLYLAHFAGSKGAVDLLRNPEASAEALLGKKAADQNGNIIRGKTAAQVAAWANRKMGRAVPSAGETLSTGIPSAEVEEQTERAPGFDFIRDPLLPQAENAPLAPATPIDGPTFEELSRRAPDQGSAPQAVQPTAQFNPLLATDDTANIAPPLPASPIIEPIRLGTPIDQAPAIPQIEVKTKQIFVRGIDAAQRSAINEALPGRAVLVPRADGSFTLPRRYEGEVRAALAPAIPPSATLLTSDLTPQAGTLPATDADQGLELDGAAPKPLDVGPDAAPPPRVLYSIAGRDTPAVVSTRRAVTLKDAEDAAKPFVGRALTNAETGIRATISQGALNKMTSESAARKSSSIGDHVLAVAHADQLFYEARLFETGPDKREEPTILAVHRYVAPLTVPDGRTLFVKMTIKETSGPNEPNPFYTIETMEVEPVSVPTASAPGQSRHAAPTGSIDNMAGSTSEYNPYEQPEKDIPARNPVVDPWGGQQLESLPPLNSEGESAADLSGQEVDPSFESSGDLANLRGAARRWYTENLLGRWTVTSDGHRVAFTNRGLKKATRKGEDLLEAVPAIQAVLQRGKLIESRPSKDQSTKAIHVYAATITVRGQPLRVGALVSETNDGDFHYDWTKVSGEEGIGSRDKPGGEDDKSSVAPAWRAHPDGLNIFLLRDEGNTPPLPGDTSQSLGDLKSQLAARGLSDKVSLRVVDTLMNDRRFAGRYSQRVIEIALRAAQDPSFTLDHEVIHALRDMGLFKPAEWTALSKAALADAKLMASVRERYSNLNPNQQVEEAVADMFASWVAGKKGRGFIEAAFRRVADFLRALGSALRSNGFTTAESVMRSIERGAVGRRGSATTDTRVSRVDPPAQEETARQVAPAKPEEDPVEGVGITDALANDEAAPEARKSEDEETGEDEAPTDGPASDVRYSITSDGSSFPAAAEEDLREDVDELASGASSDVGAAIDKFRVAVQDKMLPLLRTQQRIEAALGRSLDESENAYLGEELMTGRIGAQLEQLTDTLVRPLFETMKAESITAAEMESYLYARHAPERNKRIAEINPEFADGGGSGMTDVEAKAILARIRKVGRLESFERAAERVDAILKFAVDARVEAGLLSQADAEAWRSSYDNYVPLRGVAEVEEDPNADRPRRGSGINVRGKESQRAFGRRSKAEDILAYTILQAEEAIIRGETNRVGQELHSLAQTFPNPNFWTVDKIGRKAVFDKASGQVRYQSESRLLAEDAPYTVSLKIDGEEHRVTFNRKNESALALAEAMRNLSGQQLNIFVATFGKFTRGYSAVNTRISPPFIIMNAIRDVMAASFNLQQHNIPGLARGMLKDWRKALLAPRRGDSEWAKWRREFELAGGKVYFNDLGDVNQLRKRIERQMTNGSSPLNPVSLLRQFFEKVDLVNDHVENAVRLATYKNAREAGISKAQAASMARNVTVNFTRKGKYGPLINSGYAFFNASTQGTAGFIIAGMRSKRIRKIMVMMMVAGFAMDMLNSLISDDDDDGESFWSKVPEHEKERNIVLMLPGAKDISLKIPMPFGYNSLFNAGRLFSEAARGKSEPLDAAGNAVLSFVEGFNPLGSGGTLLNVITPSLLDPLADLYTNRDFAGKPIQPDQKTFGTDDPPSANYFPSVNLVAKAVTDTLNKVTGGDDVIPGAVSVSPEVLEYLFGYFTGAAGRFVKDIGGILAAPGDTEIEDIPIVDKVIGSKPSWYDKSAFFSRVDDIEQALGDAKKYADRGNREGFERLVLKKQDVLQLAPLAKAARKEMRGIRKVRTTLDLAHERDQIGDSEYQIETDTLDGAEQAVIAAFNRQYMSWVAKPVGPQ